MSISSLDPTRTVCVRYVRMSHATSGVPSTKTATHKLMSKWWTGHIAQQSRSNNDIIRDCCVLRVGSTRNNLFDFRVLCGEQTGDAHGAHARALFFASLPYLRS